MMITPSGMLAVNILTTLEGVYLHSKLLLQLYSYLQKNDSVIKRFKSLPKGLTFSNSLPSDHSTYNSQYKIL